MKDPVFQDRLCARLAEMTGVLSLGQRQERHEEEATASRAADHAHASSRVKITLYCKVLKTQDKFRGWEAGIRAKSR